MLVDLEELEATGARDFAISELEGFDFDFGDLAVMELTLGLVEGERGSFLCALGLVGVYRGQYVGWLGAPSDALEDGVLP